MSKKRELVAATIGEGALILVVAAIGWATRMPLIFTSLGPTAYELVEKPNAPSARLYNIIAGHMLAMGAGFFSVWALGIWTAPKVPSAGFVPSARIWAAVLAVAITTLTTLALKASQPAALSTSSSDIARFDAEGPRCSRDLFRCPDHCWDRRTRAPHSRQSEIRRTSISAPTSHHTSDIVSGMSAVPYPPWLHILAWAT